MSTNKKAEVNENDVTLDDLSYVVKLSKKYHFEDGDIDTIDLSGLETLTAEQAITAQKIITRSGNVTTLLETNVEFCLVIASFASGLPVEFFRKLNLRDMTMVKNRVSGFFFSGD